MKQGSTDRQIVVTELPSKESYSVTLPTSLKAGKNWQPFIIDGALYVLHGFDPIVVLQVFQGGHAEEVHRAESSLVIKADFDNYSMFRGGSNGINCNGCVYGLAHVSSQRHDHIPAVWALNDSRQLFFSMLTNPIDLRSKGFNIIDPTCLFLHQEYLYVGFCASEREWFYDQRFMNALIKVRLTDNYLETFDYKMLLSYVGKAFSANELTAGLASSMTFIPSRLPSSYPLRRTLDGVCSSATAGCLVHGPYYVIAKESVYTVRIMYRSNSPAHSRVGCLDVCASKASTFYSLGSIGLAGTNGKPASTMLEVSTVSHVGKLLEARVFVKRASSVEVLSIRLIENHQAGLEVGSSR